MWSSCVERYTPKPVSQRSRFFLTNGEPKVLKKNYFVIQIEKCQGKQTNINTWSNSRSEVKTNEMADGGCRQVFFCGCTSGFRKSAHILNKPIGSCYLKYAGTRGRFYYYICKASRYI
jgi:hypothetical protein